jgi:glyoxylase-like metal-dependent hydrolase (beta-lactamase superfamily II)
MPARRRQQSSIERRRDRAAADARSARDRCTGILVTHGHFDHLLGVADLAGDPGRRCTCPRAALLEARRAYTPAEQFAPRARVLVSVEHGRGRGHRVQVLSVAGHSPEHVAYYAEECLFSGDVLFAGSVGRTDLPGADWETLLASIRSLAETLPSETVVYPGHGPITTLGGELARNPFLAELREKAS